ALVPVETEPAQRVLDADDPLLAGAGDVGVLDAEHERRLTPGPGVVTRVEPVEERGARPADVERARRRGREPDLHHLVRDQGASDCCRSARKSATSAGTFGGRRTTASGTA